MPTEDTIGTVILKLDENDQVHAVRVDPVSVISPDMLHTALSGQATGCRVTDDLLTMQLANGTWIFRLGEYNPTYRGITMHLVQGEPLAGE